MPRRIAFVRALTAAALLAAPAARAQQATAAPSPAGADVIVIIPDSLANAPRTLSELLRDYVPSAVVNRSTGALGASAFVSLRDASAIRGDDPLVVIDGIRQVSYRISLDTMGLRRAPSVLDDLMIEDIARVEVLSGPAAAAAYGYDGQRGAIVVTTRAPGAGRPQLRASIASSVFYDNSNDARNFAGVSANGLACPYYAEAQGYCIATSTSRYTPLLDHAPFRSGQQGRAHIGATGGIGVLGYAAALGFERGAGTMEADAADRTTASLRLHLPIGGRVRLALASFGVERGVSLPSEGSSSILSWGVASSPIDCSPATPCGGDSVSRGYRIAPFDYLAHKGSRRRIGHLGQLVAVDVDATPSLALRTSASADLVRDEASMRDSSPPGYQFPQQSRLTATDRAWRVEGGEEARFTARVGAASATTRLSARVAAERTHDESVSAILSSFGETHSATAAALYRNRLETAIDQRLVWGDRASVGAGATRTATRWRDGRRLPAVIDPHVDAAYQLVGGAPLGILRSLRLRTAFGQASGHDERSVGDPVNGVFTTSYGGYAYGPPTFVPGKNRPDRSAEVEGGFDATLAVAASRLSVTAFQRRETLQNLYPLVATMTDGEAAAKRRVVGGELVADATAFDFPAATLHLRGQLALTHDRVVASGTSAAIAEIRAVSLVVANGQSWGAWRARGVTWNDVNANGRVELSELGAGSARTTRGRSRPANVASLAGDLRLARSFTVTALLDHVGGFDVYDLRSVLQCTSGVCPSLNSPSASLGDQARALAAAAGSGAGYIVPGDATRLRELSLSYQSAHAAALLSAASLRVTLSAYDLASWTRNRGVRAETDIPLASNQNNLLWNVVQPVPRTVALRVALGY